MGRPEMSAAMLPEIHLVRHGETEWSLAGRHTSHTDVALTARGEERARRLGERLRGIELACVLSSPRQRARRTCELAGFGGRMKLSPDLAEWNYGDYEGLTSAEIRRRHPGWNVFQHGCPGGESPSAVAQRADRVIAELRSAGGAAVLFSHGHFLRVLAARWVGWLAAEGRCLLLGTASWSILGFEHGSADEPAIVRWNDGVDGS